MDDLTRAPSFTLLMLGSKAVNAIKCDICSVDWGDSVFTARIAPLPSDTRQFWGAIADHVEDRHSDRPASVIVFRFGEAKGEIRHEET